MSTKIQGTEDAWENRQLGADPEHARAVSEDKAREIDDSLGLQMISIRLDKSLIESFKMIAEFHGVGYQPLMRDALKRFAYHELRDIVQGVVESQRKTAATPKQETSVKPAVAKKPARPKKTADPMRKAA